MVNNDKSSIEALFWQEMEERIEQLSSGLLALERSADASSEMRKLMRITHSLKGSAAVLEYQVIVDAAHNLEGAIEAWLKKSSGNILKGDVDRFLSGVDCIAKFRTCNADELTTCSGRAEQEYKKLSSLIENRPGQESVSLPPESGKPNVVNQQNEAICSVENLEQSLVTVNGSLLEDLVNRGAEHLVAGKHLVSITDELISRLERAKVKDPNLSIESGTWLLLEILRRKTNEIATLSEQLYESTLSCKHRPFADLSVRLQRLVRDTASQLGKDVKLEITGGQNLIDREILRQIDDPLSHLLRNAIDHGIEGKESRLKAKKSVVGTISIGVKVTLGWLKIEISDDGAGINKEVLKSEIIARELSNSELLSKMTEPELFAFLFLPGFTTRKSATTISGRGVGLDAVYSAISKLGGEVTIDSKLSESTKFTLKIPLRRSLQSCLLITSGKEQFALPISKVRRILDFNEHKVEDVAGRSMIRFENEMLQCCLLETVFNLPEEAVATQRPQKCIVVEEGGEALGLLTSGGINYEDLSIQNLDQALGRTAEVKGAAINDRGAVIAVLEVSKALERSRKTSATVVVPSANQITSIEPSLAKPTVLVVDDSLTVRELERKLLVDKGYDVLVAGDGLEGWALLRKGGIQLVVTDIDMPKMNGFELVQNIRSSAQFKELPIIIISYKERDEDKRKGFELGADRYLTKGSFHDSTFIEAVGDLLG